MVTTCPACSTLSGCAVSGAQQAAVSAGPVTARGKDLDTVLADSPTFWGQDDQQRWDAVEAELDGTPAGQVTPCCDEPQAAGPDEAAPSGACCA